MTWSARGITESYKKQDTNDWGSLEKFVDYQNKVVVDVGASLGATAVEFAKQASVVYALEPHPGNYQFLLDQIRIRKIGNIQPYPMAVSDAIAEFDFFVRESHGIHSLGDHNKGKILNVVKVHATTLDSFWEQEIGQQIGLLKVDVEGFENDVFVGAERLLSEKRIDAIVFEFSPKIHALRKIDILAPVKTLDKLGYDVFHMDGTPFDPKKDSIVLCDLMAWPRKT